jgi:signal peptidase I
MTDGSEADAVGEDLETRSDDRTTIRRVVWFVAVIVALLLVRSFVAEPVRVRSDSMTPTLPAGAVLLIDKLTFVARNPDVVTSSSPRTAAGRRSSSELSRSAAIRWESRTACWS